MINDESEKSFFKLAEFGRIHADKYIVEHNLSKWKLNISNCRVKGDRIHLDIGVPYSEMNLEVSETENDPVFFGKNTTRLSISSKVGIYSGVSEYFSYKMIPITISTKTQCLLFNTPYFYPHNQYTILNKEYLFTKISFSINYMQYFLQAYNDIFQDKIPFIHVKQTRESKDEYEIDMILKEYLTISYVKTDIRTATIYCHLLVEQDKITSHETNHNAKYHQITVKIPREIRTGNVYFKFTANTST